MARHMEENPRLPDGTQKSTAGPQHAQTPQDLDETHLFVKKGCAELLQTELDKFQEQNTFEEDKVPLSPPINPPLTTLVCAAQNDEEEEDL